MVRIAGVSIPEKKNIEYALSYIHGIGLFRSREILEQVQVSRDKKVSELKSEEISRIRDLIEKRFQIEGELRRSVATNIKRLRDINTYRGMRHARSLPVRGQRTKSNSRTRHGNVRRTMGSGRRKLEKK